MTEGDELQSSDFSFPVTAQPEEGIALENYNLDRVEKTVIRKVLTKHGGNVSRTAEELGLTRTSLYRRMQKYGL